MGRQPKRGCASKPDVGIIPRLSLSSPVVHGNNGSKVNSTRGDGLRRPVCLKG